MLQLRFLPRQAQLVRHAQRRIVASVLALVLTLWVLVPVGSVGAAPMQVVPAGASCAALAQMDRSVTNGANWGRTILAGHNAPGGWFGVDVCANNLNVLAPNGSSVSCDQVPRDWNRTGCAPGSATTDGFGMSFQCVELIVRFAAWAYGERPDAWGRSGYGNAPDLWLPENHPADFAMYPNGSTHAPVPGDILVWGALTRSGQPWPAGASGEHGGHIAVVAAVRDGMVITAEQNVKWGNEDHPSDVLALTQVGGRWVLSGTTLHETTLPTYRWQPTMGTSRGTYGWLHWTHGTAGTSPTATPRPTPQATVPILPTPTAAPTPTITPHEASGGLPSLAAATVITGSSSLADLTWAANDPFAAGDAADGPHAEARSLGGPTSATLSANADPASVTLADGRRFSYAVSTDGHLYVARTAPQTLGVYWFDHGAPSGVRLEPVLSATTFADGMAVAALGSDGNLWWRAGPQGALGNWQPLGRPAATRLTTSFALAGAPGSGTPLLLALGADGKLYQRVWQAPLLGSDGTEQVAAGWSDWFALHAQTADIHFAGRVLFVTEPATTNHTIGTWADTPLDVLALDTNQRLWLMRLAAGSVWTLTQQTTPAPLAELLAATALPVANGDAGDASDVGQPAHLHLYATAPTAAYQGVLTPFVSKGQQPVAATWHTLASLPGSVAARVHGVALPLTSTSSALIIAAGDTVQVAGSADALRILAAQHATAAFANPPSWQTLSNLPSGHSFNDAFHASTVDARWELVGGSAQADSSAAGLRLTPSDSDAALLQPALAGETQVRVTVTLPVGTATQTRGGLILSLDDGNRLTLLADGAGRVALCPTAWGKALTCQAVTRSLRSGTQGSATVVLRLTRHASSYIAEVSDSSGVVWQEVGRWTPVTPTDLSVSASPMPPILTATPTATSAATPTPATASTQQSPTAPPLAPLAFSVWGVLAQHSHASATAAAPTFSGFAATALNAPADTAATPSSPSPTTTTTTTTTTMPNDTPALATPTLRP